jgi:hypothetical protein
VERRADGTVAGGGSLNPGGRPKGYAEFRASCREHSPAALATLVSALSDEKLCVQAAQTLLAYGWGKPAAAPEDLDAVRDAGPVASRDVVLAALERLAKGEG